MMSARFRVLTLIPIILLSLACQAVYRATTQLSPTESQQLEQLITPSPTSPPPTVSPTPLPPTATPTPLPTFTPTPTSTTTPTLSPSPGPSPSAIHFNVFQDLWQAINDDYLYSDFNGLDWDAIYDEYNQLIATGLMDDDFYATMDEMISRLGDEHSVFLSPEDTQTEDAEFAGENNFVGIGILVNAIPERERIVIIVTFPGSPAEQVGLKSHDSILAVNGKPILDDSGFRRDLLLGPSGTQITVTVQSPGENPRELNITRGPVTGPMPVLSSRLESGKGKNIGYLLIPTFADDTIDNQVADAIEQLSMDAPLDGLILDNRHNSGGADTVARGVLSFFTRGRLGYFIDRNQIRRPMRVVGRNIENSNSVPLVVLVGSNTVSFGEIFSGILKDIGRAFIVGEQTEGNIELLWSYEFEDGSRAWIARETFRPINNPEEDWEQSGVTPHLTVSSNWDEVTLDTDPVIQAAIDHLDAQQ